MRILAYMDGIFCQNILNIQHTGTELMWMEHLSIRFNIGIVWEYSSYRLLDDVTVHDSTITILKCDAVPKELHNVLSFEMLWEMISGQHKNILRAV